MSYAGLSRAAGSAVRRLLPGMLTLCVTLACSAPAQRGTDASAGPVLTVFAAASLSDVFTTLGEQLQRDDPSVRVTFNFAGTQRLALQLRDGAAADLFAAADPRHLEDLAAAGLLDGTPVPFAQNRLAIAVEPGNPRQITGLEDLADPGVLVVLGEPQVPVGRYAREAFERAGVTVAPVSLEADVRGVVGKVALGEADAGIVYASDIVAAADRLDAVEIPAAHNVTAAYLLGALRDAPNPAAARAFADHLRSPQGQATLRDFGFLP